MFSGYMQEFDADASSDQDMKKIRFPANTAGAGGIGSAGSLC